MTGGRPKSHLRAIFDVRNPKEVGRDPFAVRRLSGKPQRQAHGDDAMERENSITATGHGTTSAPDRLFGRVIGNDGQPWSFIVKSDVRTQAREGSKSDRSTIQFKRATQPASKVGRGRHRAPQGVRKRQPRRCIARCAWRILTESEHRRRKTPASEAPSVKGALKRPKTFLHEASNVYVEPASSRLRGRKTSRRTPRHHGRRRDPQLKGWTVSDEEAGAERSEALSLLASSQDGTTRAAANEQGFRSLGCRRTACAMHPPREQSRGRRTSKGAKAQKG